MPPFSTAILLFAGYLSSLLCDHYAFFELTAASGYIVQMKFGGGQLSLSRSFTYSILRTSNNHRQNNYVDALM